MVPVFIFLHLHYSVLIRSVTDDNMREGGILPSLLKTAVQLITSYNIKGGVLSCC